jgi:hypothetical protein
MMDIELLGKIIDLMRAEGMTVNDPYDFENLMEEATHSNLYSTGRFKKETNNDNAE